MDHILIINRIGRTLMTVATRSSIQSFEIAPGPITTSVRKESYKYDAHPFTYSREALSGRLEIWDCTGRLVYSWQRLYPAAGTQQLQRPSVGLRTPSQTPRSAPKIKAEGLKPCLQATVVESVQQMQPPIGSGTSSLTPISHPDLNAKRASQGEGLNRKKRKRGGTEESIALSGKKRVRPRCFSRAPDCPCTSLTCS